MNKSMYVFNEDISLDVGKESIEIFHLVYNKSISVNINLNDETSKVVYRLSVINKDSNMCLININHNKSKTESLVICHGVNVLDKKLEFNVTGKVPNSSFKCICNQDNQIINLSDGESVIKPNLLIRNYDTVSNHSAYIGTFKESSLFYLMSRGISKSKAKEMLIETLLLGDFNENLQIVKDFYKLLKEVNHG